MPAESACMRTGHTLNAVYKITNESVLHNTTILAISISTLILHDWSLSSVAKDESRMARCNGTAVRDVSRAG